MIAQLLLFDLTPPPAPLDSRPAPRVVCDFAREAYSPGVNSPLAPFVRPNTYPSTKR